MAGPIKLEIITPSRVLLQASQTNENIRLNIVSSALISLGVVRSGANIRLKIVPPPRIQLKISTAGERGIPGPPAEAIVHITGETPTGLVNGSNATFTTEFEFVPESVQVYVNGVRQKIVPDYQTVGEQTIILAQSPLTGEHILVDYILGE